MDNEKKIRAEILLYLVYTNFVDKIYPEWGSLCTKIGIDKLDRAF